MTARRVESSGAAEEPDALDLLEVARETLLGAVAPALDGDARYQALMVANAIAIAIRELTADDTDLPEELASLRGLYETGDGLADADGAQALAVLEARLARDLREGVLDGGPQFAVRQWLRRRIEKRLAVSNPRRVASTSRDGAGDDVDER